MYALPHLVPPILQQATADPRLCWRLLDTHRQIWVSLLWGHCSFLLGPGAYKVLFVPSKHLWRVWGLIVNMILPVLPSCWGFSFALGHGVSFLGGIQHGLVNGCSAVCCNFWVLTGEDEHTSLYSAILCHLYFCNSGLCLSSQAAIMHSTILFWKFLYPGFKLPIFNAQTSPSHASTVHVLWVSRCSSWI